MNVTLGPIGWLHTAACTCALLLPAAVWGANLEVDVRGAAAGKGAVHVALYDSKDKFLKAPSRKAVVQAGEHARFDGLAPGRYAVTLYQDENGNGSLDRNVFGIPSEPYAFGNDAKGSFGPPSFEAASVELPATGAQVTINLKR